MSDPLIRALHAYLANADDPSSDARAIAARLRLLLTKLESEATQLIGGAGFHALLARSVHLNRRLHPWCSPPPSDKAETSFAALEESLSSQDPRAARAAAVDLLVRVTDLLGLFIGAHLTTELVKHAWRDVLLDGPPQESSHE